MPRRLRASIARAGALLLVPSTAYAHDCSGFIDCYGTMLAAALVIVALALFIALTWEMWAVAIAVDTELAETAILTEATTELELGTGLAEEEALASTDEAIEAERAAAKARLEQMASRSNPLGGSKNCSWVAREIDAGLGDLAAGRTPDPYAPDWYEPGPEFDADGVSQGRGQSWADIDTISSEYGGQFQPATMNGIAQEIQAAGNGARGIVYVTEGGEAHVFNVVNYGGEVFFVDGQTTAIGETSVWTDTSYASGYSENASFKFLRTF